MMLQFIHPQTTQRREVGASPTPLTSNESEAFDMAKAILHTHPLKDKIYGEEV